MPTPADSVNPPKSLDFFRQAYRMRVDDLLAQRKAGKKVVGTFCLFVPDEIIFAAGADRVVLCGGREDTIPLGEQYLPRNICPLIKSSFGSIVGGCTGKGEACPHFGAVDAVVGESTCDGKKKMFELMRQFIPTYMIDLPQKPDTPAALRYYLSELEAFREYMEQLTCNRITDDRLQEEIRAGNELRKLMQRLFAYRKAARPPITGLEVLQVTQRQLFLSPQQLKAGVARLCDELEGRTVDHSGPRIMISGCPMSAGNVKVPRLIEERGAVIVVEESCTGTRAFDSLVDESKPPMEALAERYLQIPCSCMTPNDRRVERILSLAKEYGVDGVVHYSLQSCHGYNVEKFKVQQALREAGIPMLAIETDYSASDVEQLRVRIDAFLEMLA
ncbi:double-cubane-cluster-containing anaerobic reductase [Methanocella arvoryzae]|uniref:2-hydroxyglutaryl-CoA dehydratase, component D n=1 Tax=Methanocella arvoryzae (strain DSM 22066 / NBRC 105507 / MRE50) TaxID=351160 RepID=Q0W379_METAR|nr:double-cubane-cluster-containing anaerobic reductase [Methanocella arvoryzae]CAJ37164.1 2-hydroxyglutaryl-CoA dehydratase, component D [Methanocella arvoryzae MRE50]